METKPLNTQQMYSVIADTMPTEGRDFTIDIVTRGDKQQLVVKPLTAVGRGFVPALIEQLAAKMNNPNITFTSDGVAEREVSTINTMRSDIEREAAETLRVKLDAVKAQIKAKTEALAKEDKERGKRVLTQEESKKRADASNELSRLNAQQRQMRYMLDHMGAAREKVDALARAMAEADAKKGIDWSVDFDEPVTTLFDRQDITDKLKRREMLIQQLTAHMFMVDDLTRNAAGISRQYIVKK